MLLALLVGILAYSAYPQKQIYQESTANLLSTYGQSAKTFTMFAQRNWNILEIWSDDLAQLAEETNVPLLGQIPIVQSICENGDKGTPAALNEDSITGRAFIELAENVVKQTEKRNAEQAPTHIVEMKK